MLCSRETTEQTQRVFLKAPLSEKMHSKNRIVLNNELAVEIYKCKLAFVAPSSSIACFQSLERRARGQSALISSRFGVSPKTIRDIWNHKTWAHATNHLWSHSENGCYSLYENHYPALVSDVRMGTQLFTLFPYWTILLQDGSCHAYQGFVKRGPGRPKGSRDSVPRRCRAHSAQNVSWKILPALSRSSAQTCVDDSFAEAPDSMYCIFSDLHSSSSLQSCIDESDAKNWFPSEWQQAQEPCSSIPHPSNYPIDFGDSLTLLSKDSAKLIEDDPFHFDWPHW